MENFDAVKKVEHGVAYHVFMMKDPYYVMKLMTAYVTLQPTDKRARRKFKRGGAMEIKELIYTDVVENDFYIGINLMKTTTGGMHPYSLRKIGLPNIGLVIALLGTLPSQK